MPFWGNNVLSQFENISKSSNEDEEQISDDYDNNEDGLETEEHPDQNYDSDSNSTTYGEHDCHLCEKKTETFDFFLLES